MTCQSITVCSVLTPANVCAVSGMQRNEHYELLNGYEPSGTHYSDKSVPVSAVVT